MFLQAFWNIWCFIFEITFISCHFFSKRCYLVILWSSLATSVQYLFNRTKFSHFSAWTLFLFMLWRWGKRKLLMTNCQNRRDRQNRGLKRKFFRSYQGRRKVRKSGGACSTVVGIICPPGWDRVNCSAKHWGGWSPQSPPLATALIR